jgi:hypothetical protein
VLFVNEIFQDVISRLNMLSNYDAVASYDKHSIFSFTTPEKWDVFTRKWKANKSVIGRVYL